MRPVLLLAAAILSSCESPAQLNAVDPARQVVERVFESFNSCKIEALVANYSDNNLVFFTPDTPKALTSRAELRKYFGYLESEPCSSPGSPKHTNALLQVRPLGTTTAIVHATTVVKYEDAGKAISFPFYFTFVLDARDGQWAVVSQNAQPVPKD